MKWPLIAALLILLLAACASKPERKPNQTATQTARQNPLPTSPTSRSGDNLSPQNSHAEKHDPCAPIYQHDERHYTAGGLYAPQLSDSAPASAIDASKLTEPTPKSEPLARYGNKSPYTVLGKSYFVLDKSDDYDQRGIASWYGQKFNGRKTSSGEIYSICEFTAAHKTLPLPSYVRVTNTKNGKSVVVRVNDRGPFHEGRIIDLSFVAANRIGLDRTGTAPVRVELLKGVGSRQRGYTHIDADDKPVNAANNHDDEVALQFGSFADKDNAKQLQNRLQAANIHNVELEKADINEQSVWRVQVRGLKNEQLIDIFEKARQLGLSKPKVIAQKL